MTYRISRRTFFRFGAGSALALGATACLGPDKGPGGTLAGGKADGHEGMIPAGECAATDPDALGPYWTPYLERTTQLAAPDEPGQRLVVMGRVLARDCATAVPGATVVAWQADDEGLYDYNHAGRNQGSSAGFLSTAATRLRGLFTTSLAGTYAIETIFPSEYPLNLLDPASSAYRAPHIHFAVFVTDRAGVSHQLVTQMYFLPNDVVLAKVPDLDRLNAEDFGASTAETPRLIEVTGGEVWHGEFDLVLDLDPSRVAG